MNATTILAPIVSGLLTTISLHESVNKTMRILGVLGLAAGLRLQTPVMVLQTTLKQSDLSVGVVITGFGATLGNAIWIVVSMTLFQSRLKCWTGKL
jgi:hypothetical protein